MSRVTEKPYCSILDFLSNAGKCRSAVVKPSSVDLKKAAQVISLPQRGSMQSVASRSSDVPSARVVAMVTNYIAELFPSIRGAVRQDMVAKISEKLVQDPHASQILSKVS